MFMTEMGTILKASDQNAEARFMEWVSFNQNDISRANVNSVPLRVDGGCVQLICQNGDEYIFERWDTKLNRVSFFKFLDEFLSDEKPQILLKYLIKSSVDDSQ